MDTKVIDIKTRKPVPIMEESPIYCGIRITSIDNSSIFTGPGFIGGLDTQTMDAQAWHDWSGEVVQDLRAIETRLKQLETPKRKWWQLWR